MKNNDPKQALTLVDESLPTTVINAIFDDIQEQHPLLSEIDFQNTGIITEIIVSTLEGRHMAVWGELCAEAEEELLGGFTVLDLKQKSLTAFLPVCKAMLEAGPEWLDRYVRAALFEAIVNGVEESAVTGERLNRANRHDEKPCRRIRPCYLVIPDLTATAITEITPATYGALVADLAVGGTGLNRTISEVLFIVNPVDYLTKVMPAVSYQQATGDWTQKFPFPTKVITSAFVPQDKAIIGLGKRYFFGLGTGQGGRIEYSDHHRFLQRQRVYLTELRGNGRPLDATSFKVLDITNLRATIPNVSLNGGVTINDQPLEVLGVTDARLASLAVGSLTLSPAFNKSIMYYTATTTNATNIITAVAMDGEATITIANGETPVVNGSAATWAAGENTATIEVESNGETETYTIVVTKSE